MTIINAIIYCTFKKVITFDQQHDMFYLGKVTNFEYGNFDIKKFNFENGNFEFEVNFELDMAPHGVGWGGVWGDC